MNALSEVLTGKRRWCVVHGDCLEALRSLPNQCGVIVTDVPYQVGKALDNDSLSWEEYLPWLDARLLECTAVGRRVFTTFATTRVIRFIRESRCPPDYLLHWHKPFLLHDRSLNGIEHETPKPVPLLMAALEFWADPGELIIDPFIGSGTTLVAALRKGHPCIGIDTNPDCVLEATARIEADLAYLKLGDVKRGQRGLFQEAP